MSDRPAPPAQPPAPPRTPTQARSTQGKGTANGTSGSAATPAASPARGPQPSTPPAQTEATSGAGDTAVRVGLAERIQAKIASARGGHDEPSAEEETGSSTAPARKPRQRGPRRARLRLTRIDPWSVMKTSFLLSIAFGIVTVIAVAMIWQVIDAAGVWTSINDAINEVVTEPGNQPFNIEDYVGTDRVLGFAMLVAAVDVILITAVATLGAFLYNMSAALLGGIEVTLAEDN